MLPQEVADLSVPEEVHQDRRVPLIFYGSSSPPRRRIQMTTSKKYLIITVTALLCTAVIFFNRHKSHFGQTFVHAVPVQTAYVWGYNVLAGEKIYIQQEFIPAIP